MSSVSSTFTQDYDEGESWDITLGRQKEQLSRYQNDESWRIRCGINENEVKCDKYNEFEYLILIKGKR